MNAGRDLLRENGLRALHMRDVAHGAGIALGTVYLYFANKEELYAALYAERLEEMSTGLAPVLEARPDPREFFVRFMSDYRLLHAEFGKDVHLLAAGGGEGGIDREAVDPLLHATTRVLAGIHAWLSEWGIDRPDLALTLLWSTATGLADHFSGPRTALLAPDWEDAVGYAAEKLALALLPAK